MAFNIDPNIPLQAGKVNFDPAAIIMQAQQGAAALERHRLEMQKLRDDYDAAKEARANQRKMNLGIATDMAKLQQGQPAQYAPTTFQQTPQQGQMPYGMTGVLKSEQGQNLSQPKAFGEDILAGNYQFGGGEVTQPAVTGHEPSYIEQLQIAIKNAMATGNQEAALSYAQKLEQQRQADRELSAPVGNPYSRYDDKGNFVGTFVLTRAGEIPWGAAGTTTEKPDVIKAKDKAEMLFKQQQEDNRQAAELARINAETQRALGKPDPVAQALAITQGKEDIKDKAAQTAKYREKYANADDAIPLLDNYISALKNGPQSGISKDIQSVLGYFHLGDKDQQTAMGQAEQAGEALLTFAQKQPGPSTDKDVASYRAQMGVINSKTATVEAKIAAAEQAKVNIANIKTKYGNYADNIINGKVTLDEKPTTVEAKVTPQTKIVKTRADLEKVKSGETYIAPDGKPWVKP